MQPTFTIGGMTYEKFKAALPLIKALVERGVLGYTWRLDLQELGIKLLGPYRVLDTEAETGPQDTTASDTAQVVHEEM